MRFIEEYAAYIKRRFPDIAGVSEKIDSLLEASNHSRITILECMETLTSIERNALYAVWQKEHELTGE